MIMLTTKNYGKHTAYSRYKSQIVPTNPLIFEYVIDPDLWPVIPDDNFRVMNLNCCRFPKTFYAKIIIANLILSAKPDIVLLQEISGYAYLRDMIDFINTYNGSRLYAIQEGHQSIRNLSLCILYKIDSLSYPVRNTLFQEVPGYDEFFPRLPLQVQFIHSDFNVTVVNNHLVSHHYRNHTIMRESAFEALGAYFDWTPTNELLLCGGDFNLDTDGALYAADLPQFEHDYGIYRNNSDIMMFHDYNLGPIVKAGYKQYLYDFNTYLNITDNIWQLYVSDHKPIVLDMPL